MYCYGFFCAFLTLGAKGAFGFFSFSYLIFSYLSTQTHIHTHAPIPPIEWDRPLLYDYWIYEPPHKCGLLLKWLYHAVRWYNESIFCTITYLHTTDAVQPHRGAQ